MKSFTANFLCCQPAVNKCAYTTLINEQPSLPNTESTDLSLSINQAEILLAFAASTVKYPACQSQAIALAGHLRQTLIPNGYAHSLAFGHAETTHRENAPKEKKNSEWVVPALKTSYAPFSTFMNVNNL